MHRVPSISIILFALLVLSQACGAHRPELVQIASAEDNWRIQWKVLDGEHHCFSTMVEPLTSNVSGDLLLGKFPLCVHAEDTQRVWRYLGITDVKLGEWYNFTEVNDWVFDRNADERDTTDLLVTAALVDQARIAAIVGLAVVNGETAPLGVSDRQVLTFGMTNPGFVQGIKNLASRWDTDVKILGSATVPDAKEGVLYLTVDHPGFRVPVIVEVDGRPRKLLIILR